MDTYNPRVHPLATSIEVTDKRINPIVNRAKKVISKERVATSMTRAAAPIAIAADPYLQYKCNKEKSKMVSSVRIIEVSRLWLQALLTLTGEYFDWYRTTSNPRSMSTCRSPPGEQS
jgi:phenylalanyl-tRNA synthetase beta subunit